MRANYLAVLIFACVTLLSAQQSDAEIRHVTIWSDGTRMAGDLNLPQDLKEGEKRPTVLVCAGTGDGVADEDVLAAKAILENLQPATGNLQLSTEGLAAAIGNSQNGRRLLANPDLRADVAFCAQRDVFNFVVALDASGALRKL